MKITNIVGHQNPIYSIVSVPNKPLIFTAGNDRGIVQWDIEKAVHVNLLKPISSTIYALCHIATKNVLVAGANNGMIHFFDLTTNQLIQTITHHAAIFSLVYVDHKDELIASTDKGEILIINPNDFEIIHQFPSGNQKIRTIEVSKHLHLLVSVSNDENIRIFDLSDYSLVHEFMGHPSGVGAATFTKDGKILITGGRDAHLKFWETDEWSLLNNFAAHLFPIYKIIEHPSLPYFASASRDKSIKIWRRDDFSLYKNLSASKGLDGHSLSVNDMCWSTDGEKLISVGDDKLVKIWALEF